MYLRPKPVAPLGILGQSWPVPQPLDLWGPHPRPAPCSMCTNATVNLVPSRIAEKQFDCHLQGDIRRGLMVVTEGETEAQRDSLTCVRSPSLTGWGTR